MKINESRFGTLLKVREHQERKAQQELNTIRTEKNAAENALTEMDEKRNTEIKGAANQGKARAKDLQTSRAFIRKLSQDIQQQENKIETIKTQEETKRVEVVGRSQEKEMVERLEEKYQAHAAKEKDRKEQRVVDILAQRVRASL
jgi:flagellar export protein FliJ